MLLCHPPRPRVQVFNHSPDETAFFQATLTRESLANCYLMVQVGEGRVLRRLKPRFKWPQTTSWSKTWTAGGQGTNAKSGAGGLEHV